MSMLNRPLLENLFGRVVLKKKAIFHCADRMVREAVGKILEIDLNCQKIIFFTTAGS